MLRGLYGMTDLAYGIVILYALEALVIVAALSLVVWIAVRISRKRRP